MNVVFCFVFVCHSVSFTPPCSCRTLLSRSPHSTRSYRACRSRQLTRGRSQENNLSRSNCTKVHMNDISFFLSLTGPFIRSCSTKQNPRDTGVSWTAHSCPYPHGSGKHSRGVYFVTYFKPLLFLHFLDFITSLYFYFIDLRQPTFFFFVSKIYSKDLPLGICCWSILEIALQPLWSSLTHVNIKFLYLRRA